MPWQRRKEAEKKRRKREGRLQELNKGEVLGYLGFKDGHESGRTKGV